MNTDKNMAALALITRMKELISLLHEASRVYYNENREIMSNQEYDALYDELTALEASAGVTLAGSPTQTVGYEALSNLIKVRHDSPMLSLDKTKDIAKLQSFLGEQTGLISWKLDGMTIVLRYTDGALSQAVTRGNGEIGEDVTHNARVFENVPLKIHYTDECVVRGEAVIGYAAFDRINDALLPDEKYKNPRNLCSGTVRQLNSAIAAGRGVHFYAFSLIKAAGMDFQDSKKEQMRWLAEVGFETVETEIIRRATVEDVVRAFESRISKNDFASDGLVLTYDSLIYSESLGSTSKFPKDAIAFKWADEMHETTLLEIQWSTSRTGLINPVAVFEPVEIEGSTVNKASLHNVSILENLALGVGDVIKVFKANMIIPQVAENLSRSNTAAVPELCPECGGAAEIIRLKEGKALYCANPDCRAQLISALAHFASRDAMNMEGLSQQTLEKFVEQGFIENYTDIFYIDRFKQEIISMKGLGEKSFTKLTRSIEKSKTTTLSNLIYALGIREVGLSHAKLLCGYYDNNIEKIIRANPEELAAIEGFGEVISQSVCEYFANEKNAALIRKVLPILRFTASPRTPRILSEQTFVITGELNHFKNRAQLRAAIESLGGKVTASVTSKTGFLINNNIQSESSKNKKAKELGVPIITEEEFTEKFHVNEGSP
ncbi:MAG: NAD-dependent DNA ligase LigA [Clostridiales bacterium]|jgi:DNA ligase (NAD+)|nr:NAD-dependent DNA ligase LigA [Clostridiales bacterium]